MREQARITQSTNRVPAWYSARKSSKHGPIVCGRYGRGRYGLWPIS